MYSIHTLLYFPAFLKPFVPLWLFWNKFRHFLLQTTKPQPVWVADRCVHIGSREKNTLIRCIVKEKDGQRGEENSPALWFDGYFWRKLVKRWVLVWCWCVCPNKCVSLSSSASDSNKRCKPRLQNGSGGRKITFCFPSFIYYLSGYLGGERLCTALLQNEAAEADCSRKATGLPRKQKRWKTKKTIKERKVERTISVGNKSLISLTAARWYYW